MAESHSGSVMPYGVAIREAVSSGDQSRMRQAEESARAWLAKNAGHESFGDVQAALRELSAARGS
jgi:hypothetical protein